MNQEMVTDNFIPGRTGLNIKRVIVAVMGAFWLYFILSPIFDSRPLRSLIMEIKSNSSGNAQLFYNSGRGFNETDSASVYLKAGTDFRNVSLALPLKDISDLRLDPLDGPGTIQIRNMSVVGADGKYPTFLNLGKARPVNDIEKAVFENGVLSISTTRDGRDPYLILDLPASLSCPSCRHADRVRRSLLFSMCALISGLASWFFFRKRNESPVNHKSCNVNESAGLYWLLVALALPLRMLSIFTIYPGNAPDEVGHLMMVTALSNGHIPTLAEILRYSGYPYAIYNPLPYLPGSLSLAIGSLLNPFLNVFPPNEFSFAADFWARGGQLFWAIAYLVLAVMLTRGMKGLERIVLFLILAFIPQIIFVQSYVNLDTMGIPLTLYVFWAASEGRLKHLCLGCFLICCAKMNFICLLALPLIVIWNQHHEKTLEFIKTITWVIVIPCLLASTWFLVNYFYITGNYRSFLGFTALPAIYNFQPGGLGAVLSYEFFRASVNSSFAVFGWMNQPLQSGLYYSIWLLFFLLPAFLFLVWKIFKSDRRTIDTAVILVIFLNVCLHCWASFSNAVQAQGRYLFPTIILLAFYWVELVRYLFRDRKAVKKAVYIFMIIFILLAEFQSQIEMSRNPFGRGFQRMYQGREQHTPIESMINSVKDK